MAKQIVIGIAAVIVIVGSFFWLRREKPEKYSGPAEKVTLGAETSLLTAAVWVAEYNGYFKEEGLDLSIQEFESGKLSFLAMLKGEVDISTVAPTPIVLSSFERPDFSIFATFVYSNDDVKVIARKDKGIATAQDLIGKRIGTPAGTTGDFFVEVFLIHNAIPPSQLEVVDIAPAALPAALEKNDVDAIVIWEPHAYNARQRLPNKSIRLPGSEIYRETFNFVAMKEFTQNNPARLEKFLRSVDRATIFINKHKSEAQAIISQRLKLDKQSLSDLWEDYEFEMSLDQSLIITLEDEARWAIKKNLTDQTAVPNYLDYIDFNALEKVVPEAVTLIR